ncbi:SRPBCC family protein [Nonomuraea sp. NPDC005983]|uniref:aromatic ring-hydroxylating oxygenase subunit alpha n=1 Tax=Nonomuraea sp. NPDC005983 TaxID=3155595 RepID=UPI0033AB8416
MTPDSIPAIDRISAGYDPDPALSMSLHADAYTDPMWFDVDQRAIFARTWQWLCHVEQLRETGSYMTGTVAGMPIVAVRDEAGTLRAFYNVCKHRAHELLSGSGVRRSIVCPYHAWNFDLTGRLSRARNTGGMPGFDASAVCLDQIQVAEFGGMVYVNLDPGAALLSEQAGGLEAGIEARAPDVAKLTLARRLTYDIASNWKNVVDNFLECYHCHVAHKDFVSLVDMSTYKVTTYGIYSSHMAQAGKADNSAYDVSGATVTEHAVWWLWPNTCLLRYPGRGNFMVLQIIPDGPERTREIWDFYLETTEPNEAELDSIRYIDEVLQVEDISLVESVQRGMRTPAFTQGKIVYNPDGSGLSEHAVHHFHGLVLDAYRHELERSRSSRM